MASDLSDEIRSTFPLKAAEIAKRKWSTALFSPISWAPFLPAVGAYAFLDVPGLIASGLVAAVAGGLVWYWRRQGDAIERKVIEEMVTESNREQDKALTDRMRALHRRGKAAYAVNFGKFLKSKQEIETAIHQDGDELTNAKEEVEKLVDSLCFGVADEFDRLAQLDELLHATTSQAKAHRTERDELVERIQRAYETLTETQTNLPVILNPAGSSGGRESRLDDVIARLKEEADIAKRVSARLKEDSDLTTSTTTTSSGSSLELE